MHPPRLLSRLVASLAASLGVGAAQAQSPASPPSPIVLSEFIADPAPTPQAHASTLLETRDGRLLAAWFGGAHEGAADVGIWLAQRGPQQWQTPRHLADGAHAGVDGAAVPAWNPVLFQSATGPLQLYYKLGPNPRQWWGLRLLSTDDGAHWSPPQRLPDAFSGRSRTNRCSYRTAASWRQAAAKIADGARTWNGATTTARTGSAACHSTMRA